MTLYEEADKECRRTLSGVFPDTQDAGGHGDRTSGGEDNRGVVR